MVFEKFLVKLARTAGKLTPKIEINSYYKDDIKHLKDCHQKIEEVKWTEKQTEKFNSFWMNNYGKTIPQEGTKLFEYISGKHNDEFIPAFFYRKVIEPYFNPYYDSLAFDKKNLYEFLFGGIEGLRFPHTYLSCMNGCYRIDNDLISLEEAVEKCYNIGKAIIKPTMWTGSGRFVRSLNIVNGKDVITDENIKEIFMTYGTDFIVQEKIINSSLIRKISPKSLNTFRITTYILDGKIYTSPIALRLGCGDSEVDNVCAGGLSIGVDDNGYLMPKAHNHGQSGYQEFCCHPDTKTEFEGCYVGKVELLKETVIKMHSRITFVGIVAWDLTFDDNDIPVMIEANFLNQSVDFAQFATGESLFRDNTKKILSKLPKKDFSI